MKSLGGQDWKKFCLASIAFAAIVSSSILWTRGLLHSPLLDPLPLREEKVVQDVIESKSLDLQKEKILAESYWLRYSDIRDNSYWGEKGPMGILGPRDHFLQHGKREGRIFAPVVQPQDLQAERELAEDYWRRYPAIRNSPVWGEKSKMGFLGPRDHYQQRGRHLGYTWELGRQEKR